VQLLSMLKSSPAVHSASPGDGGIRIKGEEPDPMALSPKTMAGSIRLQFDLGFGHSFALSIPQEKKLMEMSSFVEHALHQSGPGQMLLVTQLTDRNGVQLPNAEEDGGQLAVGQIFSEMDVVSVVCRQRTGAPVGPGGPGAAGPSLGGSPPVPGTIPYALAQRGNLEAANP